MTRYPHCLKAMDEKKMASILRMMLFVLMIAGFPCQACGDDDRITVFQVEFEPYGGEKNSANPVKDFYINGGRNRGISESTVLEAFREVNVLDPETGNESKVSIPVGKLKVITSFDETAIARITSLTSSDDTPVLRYRTVMVGDYVVPAQSRPETHAVVKEEISSSQAPDLLLSSKVLFDLDTSDLKAEAAESLSVVKDMFKESEEKDILIEGHTCNLGSPEYNMALSRRRAQSVADYLADKMGIPAHRIHVQYYGDKKPIASNDTNDGRARNRRVAIYFLPTQ